MPLSVQLSSVFAFVFVCVCVYLCFYSKHLTEVVHSSTLHCLVPLCPANYRGANKWFHQCLLKASTSICILLLSICVCICICIYVWVFIFVFVLRPIIEVLINGAAAFLLPLMYLLPFYTFQAA